jgi:hypothetical protein
MDALFAVALSLSPATHKPVTTHDRIPGAPRPVAMHLMSDADFDALLAPRRFERNKIGRSAEMQAALASACFTLNHDWLDLGSTRSDRVRSCASPPRPHVLQLDLGTCDCHLVKAYDCRNLKSPKSTPRATTNVETGTREQERHAKLSAVRFSADTSKPPRFTRTGLNPTAHPLVIERTSPLLPEPDDEAEDLALTSVASAASPFNVLSSVHRPPKPRQASSHCLLQPSPVRPVLLRRLGRSQSTPL